MWTSGIYTGFPLLAAVETGSLYPTNLLLFGLLDPYLALAWAQILPLILAGIGTFLLAREYALPLASCLLAAGSFALSGFFVSHLRQLNMVDAAAWIPVLMLLVERALRGGRLAPLVLAVAWALQLLAGHPQISYFTGLVLAPFALVRWRQIDRVREDSPERSWPIRLVRDPVPRRLAVAVLAGTLLAGAQLVPGLELSSLSHRQGGFSFAEASAYPADPRNVWTFFLPYRNGDPGQDTYRLSGIFWEQYGYLGLAPALLAMLAIVTGWRSPLVRLLAAMVAVCGLLVLGPATPVFHWAFVALPGMSYFRFPTRFLVFVELGLALLAALGLARVLDRVRWPGAVAATVLVVTAADLWAHQTRQLPTVSLREWTSPIATVEYLRRELGNDPSLARYYSLDSAFVHAQTFHGAGGWAEDRTPYVRLRAMLQPSSNLLHGLESPDGYANLAPAYYESVWGSDKQPGMVRPSGELREDGWHLKPEVSRLLRMFNVRYVLSAYPARSPDLGPPLFVADSVGVQEVLDPLPRAFVVPEARVVTDDREALAVLRSEGFDPSRTALVHEPEAALQNGSGSGSARVLERAPRLVRIEAKSDGPALLVFSEGYYPGWTATVDGSDATVYRANVMMRAVRVPGGTHEIVMRFSPWALRAGLLVSALGFAILLAAGRRWTGQKPR